MDHSKLIGSIEAIEKINESGDTSTLEAVLKDYVSVCGSLTLTDPETILRAQKALGRAIISHAKKNSAFYSDKIDSSWVDSVDCLTLTAGKFFVEKSDLVDNKEEWQVDGYETVNTKTSGTTGKPFSYKIWKDFYLPIEKNLHYKLILDEFEVSRPVVLYVETGLPVKFEEVKYGSLVIKVADQWHFQNDYASLVASHGFDGAEYHHIAFDTSAYLNVYDYCRYVVNYMMKNKVNVLLTTGAFIELFTTFLIADDSAVFPKLADLISNTGDKVNVETLNFLKETGVTKNWCDHMRCWDGGAGFFTCKEGTYHLQEELAYVFTDEEGKLCSIDFFSYPNPFINYLNGDYCSVGDEFKKCACGRWHREFSFHNRRPRQYTNNNGGYYDTEDVVKSLLGKFPLGFFSVQDGSVSIEDSNLDEQTKEDIVLEMAKIYIMVHFFTNPQLSEMSRIRAMAGASGDICTSCGNIGLSCAYNPKTGDYECTT